MLLYCCSLTWVQVFSPKVLAVHHLLTSDQQLMRSQLVGDSVFCSSRVASCTLYSTPFLFYYCLSSLLSSCTMFYLSFVPAAYSSSVSSTAFISWWNLGKTDTERHWVPYSLSCFLVEENMSMRTEHRTPPHIRSFALPICFLWAGSSDELLSCTATSVLLCFTAQRWD